MLIFGNLVWGVESDSKSDALSVELRAQVTYLMGLVSSYFPLKMLGCQIGAILQSLFF
jgi:hypothetical protein